MTKKQAKRKPNETEEEYARRMGVVTRTIFEEIEEPDQCINPESHKQRGEDRCNGSCFLYTNNNDDFNYL